MPLALGRDGGLRTLAQGSAEEIGQSLGLLLETRPGERQAVPDYGLPDSLGTGVRTHQVVSAAAAYEDRASAVDVELAVQVAEQAATVHGEVSS